MTSPLAILHVLDGRFHCGASVVTRMLINALQQEGIDAKLVCLYEGEVTDVAREEGLDPIVLPPSGTFFTRLAALEEVLKTEKQHNRLPILHSHQMRANRFACLAASRQHLPHVITLHTHNEELIADLFPNPIKRAMIRTIHHWTLKRASARIAVSPGLLRDLLSRGYPPNGTKLVRNIATLPDQVDDQRKIRDDLCSELGISTDSWIILSAGRLVAVKQFDLLIRALQEMRTTPLDRAVVLLAGEGDLREELENLAKDLGLEERIHFLGWRDDLQNLISACDCAVSTSRSECSPVFVIEAMSLCRPVVAGDAEDVAALLEDGKHGLLFSSGQYSDLVEKLSRVMTHPEWGHEMGQAAREHISSLFDSAQTVRQTLEIYQEIARGAHTRTSS